MSEPTLVPLNNIKANPYQPRTDEDTKVIEEIAINIYRNGLMQIPSARRVNGHYQLVFGHTRKAAYELLATKGVPTADITADKRYANMPLHIHELDDRQMFEMAVAENIKRRDLNPIEQATAMKRYMEEFNANSKQAAELFGVNDATVRGKVRLLDLPEKVKNHIREGKISESAARLLVSAAKLVPDELDWIVKEIMDGDSPEGAVESAFASADNLISMYDYNTKWLDAKKFPNKHLPELTAKQAANALGVNLKDIEPALASMKAQEDLNKYDADLIEKLSVLYNPPLCTACPLSVKNDGTRYCSLKACHSRKQTAWQVDLVEKASKETGVAIYDKSADGEGVMIQSRIDGETIKQTDKKNLRLTYSAQYIHFNFKGLGDHVAAVLVGEAAQKQVADAKKNAEKRKAQFDYNSPEYKARERRREENQKLIVRFVWETCVPAFAVLTEAITQVDFLSQLVGNKNSYGTWNYKNYFKPSGKLTKKEVLQLLQQRLVFDVLQDQLGWDKFHDYADSKTPLRKTASFLQGLAKSWGVALPKNFMTTADQMDESVASVSTETVKAKK